ncbi:hypothetical protein BDW02DRAFT_565028 [Decorospora gaudefroyi]|uniref:Uncharacterized protein n=1 Tax=Decorospora gaudefroyi TaxID=184978 RepID=A0A6A5KQQ9_9PLEO|nr:hypothetical protein BDW02DRAFT_565028 [Decorospora gaudefroyi]
MKAPGLRMFANLLRWQLESGRPQPAGGTVALGQFIDTLGRVERLVAGFVADKGGQQQEFDGADFRKWALAWRYFRTDFWAPHGEKLRQQLQPATYQQQLSELVQSHEEIWPRFVR